MSRASQRSGLKYANTSIKKISENLIVTNDANKGTTTIMSVLKKSGNNDKLTGVIIGNLPQQSGIENSTRAGILGYNNDNEVYGFFDNGSGFIGKDKAIEIISKQ